MQINFNPAVYKIHKQTPTTSSQNSHFMSNTVNSFNLLNYSQVTKNIVSFRGTKIENAQDEINELDRILIEPLKMQNCSSVPTSVLLGFDDDLSEKTILENIRKRANAEFVTISSSGDELMPELKTTLNTAKNRYLKDGKRTIVVIKDAEKVIGMTMAYAKTGSDFELSDKDLRILENAGNSIKKINYFKSLLDCVSEAPRGQDDGIRSAATILFTTKNPYLIHPDLFSRDGKIQTIMFPKIETSSFKPTITSIPYNGKQLEYAPNKKADLYCGDLGYNRFILWAQPGSKDTLNGVLDNLGQIRQEWQFKDVTRLQMSKFDGIEEFKKMQPISNYDADGKRIFEMWI